jgi:hypothetical protein
MKRRVRSRALPAAGSGYFTVRSLVLALTSGAIIAGCGVLMDYLIHGVNRIYASDVYTFAVGFLLSYALLLNEDRRRANLARRMHIAADVNHHIRNALTGVVFSAAVRNDPALQAVLQDATARIDWVLNTVLPDGTSELQWPVQAKEWSPSSWEGPE